MSYIDVQNTLTQIQSDTNKVNSEKSKVGTSDLGQDAFLRLMMAQMKNQDPTKPLDNSQMMLQTAQFTQVQELQKMNGTNTINQAYSLMDKKVTMLDPNDTSGRTTITGKVSEVRTDGSTVSVLFAGDDSKKAYPLKNVQSVTDSDATTTGVTRGKSLVASSSTYRGLQPYTEDETKTAN